MVLSAILLATAWFACRNYQNSKLICMYAIGLHDFDFTLYKPHCKFAIAALIATDSYVQFLPLKKNLQFTTTKIVTIKTSATVLFHH